MPTSLNLQILIICNVGQKVLRDYALSQMKTGPAAPLFNNKKCYDGIKAMSSGMISVKFS